MTLTTDQLIGAVWLIGFGYWVVLAFGAKRTRTAAPTQQQLAHYTLGTVAGVLFCGSFRGTVLAETVLPRTPLTGTVGLAVLVLGMSFTFWSRAILGRNWSAIVTIKEGHQLIRRGPYAIVRHPIYTGLIASLLGTAIAFGRVHHFLAVVAMFGAYWRKSRLEERWLTQEFGAEYERYRREVRALVPFVL